MAAFPFFSQKINEKINGKKINGEKQNKKQKMSESEKHKKFGAENKGKKGKMNNTFFEENISKNVIQVGKNFDVL